METKTFFCRSMTERLDNMRQLLKRLQTMREMLGSTRGSIAIDATDALTCNVALERYIKQEEGLMGRDHDRQTDMTAAKAPAAPERASGLAGSSIEHGYDFGCAFMALKRGRRIARRRWGCNGDMYLALHTPAAHERMTDPYLYIRTPLGQLEPVSIANLDLFATDWYDAGPV